MLLLLLTLYTKTNYYADNNSAKHFNILIMLFLTLTLMQILMLLLILKVMPGIVTIKNYTKICTLNYTITKNYNSNAKTNDNTNHYPSHTLASRR